MSLFSRCRHKFEKKIDDKGYQFCEKCGKAIQVKTKCNHKWVIHSDTVKTTLRDVIIEFLFVMRCEKCGEMKTHRIGVNDRY